MNELQEELSNKRFNRRNIIEEAANKLYNDPTINQADTLNGVKAAAKTYRSTQERIAAHNTEKENVVNAENNKPPVVTPKDIMDVMNR